MSIDVGQKSPAFELDSDKMGKVSLANLSGKKVVLFFYPKDDTPGCTKESCEFRDLSKDFSAKNAQVFGVSADDISSHEKFSAKFSLNFPLLADPEHKMLENYGVWGEQEWQGKKYMGIARTTVVVDEKGQIAKVYKNVNPVGHAAQVLSEI